MTSHPVWNVDPILLHLGPIHIHWYGLLFALGIFIAYTLVIREARAEGIAPERLEPIFLPVVLGVVIGARLVHCLFYEPDFYLSHPLEILAIWKGGLASHGGILGGILGLWWGARRQKIPFLWLLSRVAVAALPAAALIRIGNFFNSEILGKPTELPWGIVFARVDALPRHPVMLYEALGYLLIFAVLWTYLHRSVRDRALDWMLTGWALVLVFTWRILLEWVKVPQADYSTGLPLNVGQLLSLPFLLLGAGMILYGKKLRRRYR